VDWYSVYEWIEESALGAGVRESIWLFPALEAIHLVAFGALGGLLLVVDLRLLGLGLPGPVAPLARSVRPWLIAAVVVLFATGIPMFASEAIKCYYSIPFNIKMIALALSVLFTFTARPKVIATTPDQLSPYLGKLAAVVSVGLWGTVAWGGRWIGFSG